MQNSDRGDMNSELRYATVYEMNIFFQRPNKPLVSNAIEDIF